MPRRRSRRWRWIVAILIVLLVLVVLCVRIVITHAEPILRTRVIETLATRFKSRIELSKIHVSIVNGLEVSGEGLKVFGVTDPNPYEDGVQPLLEIPQFRFHTSMSSLFREPMHVETVYVKGLTMNIPPKEDRHQMNNVRRGGRMSIVVDQFICEDTTLIINTLKPGKLPLEFDISSLKMKDIGPGQPLRFDAILVNPKPTGDIESTGQFGPLNEESPRDTAVEGNYSFTHADLGTLKGIAGILSSTGKYGGTLGRIVVSGKTDTPDFRVIVCQHPVALHTDFHAVVDGTDGDTYLLPVKAHFLHSSFTASGKVVRVNSGGHDIELNVVLGHARIEDLLTLGVRTDPPIMNGPVEMTTKLSIPPNDQDLASRIKLDGHFRVPSALFANDKLQNRIDTFSLRSQGKPKQARQPVQDHLSSDMSGIFKLNDGVLSFSLLHFTVPGARAALTGQYSLDGATFDFHGHIRMDAKLSQTVTGWKSLLLKPVDPFFHKNGAGTELPIKITGTNSEPHFGLDFRHKDESKKEDGAEAANAK
jgi:hypothetical protein